MGVALLAFLLQGGWCRLEAAMEIDPTNRYAWSQNAGWVNFAPSNGGAQVHFAGANGYLGGHAWAPNIGWVKLGADAVGPYGNNSATNWGVNLNAEGNLSGFAWSPNVGWIKFNPDHGGVRIDMTNGYFSGYAWGANVGWIKFQGSSPDYGVRTAETPMLVVLFDFYLQENNGVVQVCWRTSYEGRTVGFDVFREVAGIWVKVNATLVPSAGEMGGSYQVADAAADGDTVLRYKLVEHETDGRIEEYGPFDRTVWSLRMENLVVTQEGVVIRWLSREQDVYEVMSRPDLQGDFISIATGIAPTPPVNTYTDEVAGAAFYLIRARSPEEASETGNSTSQEDR